MGYVLGPMNQSNPHSSSPARRSARSFLALTLGAGVLSLVSLNAQPQESPSQAAEPAQAQPAQTDEELKAAEAALEAAFNAAGVFVDRDQAAMAFPVTAEVRMDRLEYVLVNPHGAIHETLLVTPVDAQVLGAAFLAVGAEAGKNVEYVPKDPQPTPDEARAGAKTHDVIVPSGKPVYLYAAWREGAGIRDEATGKFPGETLHFHRIEDLIVDLERDRTLRRHGWIWLGSRVLPPAKSGGPERFAADVTGTLACVSFFPQGDTLLTPALPECNSQTSWIANRWLLPAPGAPMLLIGSSQRLSSVPESFAKAVPLVEESAAELPPAGGSAGSETGSETGREATSKDD